MPEKIVHRAYGLWDSPISPKRMAGSGSISGLAWNQDGTLVWSENRPGQSGVLVMQPPDGQAPRDLTRELSARGSVGYGGGEFTVGDGAAFFAESASGRLYRQPLAPGLARPLTPGFGRAAAPVLSPDGRWLLFVHSYEERDVLAIVDTEGRLWPQQLASGSDFYMQPTWSPDGSRVAWVEWNFPNMPWDGTFLRLARLEFPPGDGLPVLGEVLTPAGDERTSIFQPEFSPDGRFLAYVSDASGWGQIYLFEVASGANHPLTQMAADHGKPAWIQGMRRFAFGADGLYFLRNTMGTTSLWRLDLDSGQEQRLPLEEGYTDLDQIGVWAGAQSDPRRQGRTPGSSPGRSTTRSSDRVALLGSGPATPQRLITYSPPASGGAGWVQVVRRTAAEDLPPEIYSAPEALTWPGMDDQPVHGLFFPPHNPAFEGKGLPPLIVYVHGGPTSQVTNAFNLQAQFFTSRGYAFLAVNYRGSTGYGRPYQDALLGNWGIYDVQDSVSGARALADQGRVDAGRMVIMGGSAGGYTVLKALEDYPGFFKAGVCLYGISNQFTAATETHKFELHYNDLLLGELPEASELYHERSPIFFADRIQDAVAVFQGEDDPVVRRDQSDTIVELLKRRGVPHIYHVYPGEGHGFRKPETIEHYYTTVEKFLRHYVIFA